MLRRQLAAVGQQVCMVVEGRPPGLVSGVAGPNRGRAGVPRKREDGRGEPHAEGSNLALATSEEVLARADRHHEGDALAALTFGLEAIGMPSPSSPTMRCMRSPWSCRG